MFRQTPRVQFYRSFKEKSILHPGRRWVYHKALGGILLFAFGGSYISYRKAGWSETHDGHICGPSTRQLMELVPFSFFSSVFASIAASLIIPEWGHQSLIEWYSWWYGVNLSEISEESVKAYPTLDAFFVRTLRDGVRPVAPADDAALLVSPVDGLVLSNDEVVRDADDVATQTSNRVVQVKGSQYSLKNLFRIPQVESTPPNRTRKHVAFVLRAQDYHHVHTPCALRVEEMAYVPGAMMPMSLRGFRWLANIFCSNERVCIRASPTEAWWSTKSSNGAASYVWMALVGGTLRGKIEARFDGRLKTNLPVAPEYAIRWHYETSDESKKFSRGDDMARFRWGSAVVLVADVPNVDGNQYAWLVKPGDVVKVGQPILELRQ
jgi:phosphatidylserine decarboxylase